MKKLFLFAVLLVPAFAQGAVHHVRAGATGTGTGADWTNACTGFTGSCAAATLVRGDTYYVAGGTYPIVAFSSPVSGTTTITIKKPTIADHGSATGWSDTYASTVARWFNAAQGSGDMVSFNTGYWIFDGVTGGGPASWTTGFGFVVDTSATKNLGICICSGTSNVTVRHVEVIGDGGDGDGVAGGGNKGIFTDATSSNDLIEYMYNHDQGEIPFYIRSNSTTLQYSRGEHNESTPGQHAEGLYASRNDGIKITGLVVRYNMFKNIEGTAHVACECDGWDVYGNIFWGTAGIAGTGLGNGAVSAWTNKDCINVKVYNNTFLNTNQGINFFTGGDIGVRSNIVAYNNLFKDTVGNFTNVTTHDYSWFLNGGGTFSETNPQTGLVDPFVNAAAENFHLTAHTNTGLSLAAPYNVDPDGVARVPGTWDRGAYQFASSPSSAATAPVVFFTDLTSGPNTGGENNNGTILTIYGRNFGATQGTSTVKIGGGTVAAYLLWGGRSKAGTTAAQVETISVAIGASAATGIVVVTTGQGASTCEDSLDSCQFTVRSGNIRCVSTTGNDGNSGSFPSSCWATIPKAASTVAPGDIAYVQNGVVQNTASNFGAAIAITGNTCTITSPCALVAYPSATATMGAAGLTFGIRTPAVGGVKDYWTIAGFNIVGQTGMDLLNVTGWRVINNDFNCPQGGGQSACMHTDTTTFFRFYGNYTHNVGDQLGTIDKFYHGNYYTTNSNHLWIGWNEVNNNPTGSTTQGGCRAVQFFSTSGANQFDLHVHDNLIHNSICDGLNFSTVNPSQGTVEAYNNIIYHVGTGPDPANGASHYSCIIVGGGGTGTALVYNNTLYDCGGRRNPDSGALDFSAPPMGAWNNIIYQFSGESYLNSTASPSFLSGSNNIWFGLGNGPSATTGNINADPKFVSPGTDFTLLPASPAVQTGSTTRVSTWDFTGITRPVPPSIGAFEPLPMGPLVQSSNTNYFKTPLGKTIVLVGTHTWNTVQDTDTSPAGTSSLQALDYNAYIANLVAWGHNTTILWHKDLPHYCSWTGGGGGDWTMGPWQWTRTGPGNATDGGLKFDLNTFNQSFFDRVRARAITAQQNGIYAIVELFDGLGLFSNRCSNDGFPLTAANNINGISDGGGTNSMTMTSANVITSFQEAYVKKMVDTLNDLQNVIWEPSEEAPAGVKTFWQAFMVDLLHKYEGGGTLTQTGEVFTAKPFQHPVLNASTQDLSSDSFFYNSNSEAVSPAAKFSPTSSCGTGTPLCKVNINDSDHSYFGIWNDPQLSHRTYIWDNATNGAGIVFMDPYVIFNSGGNRNTCASPVLGVCPAPVTTAGSYQMGIRLNMGYVNQFLNGKMNLTSTTVQHSLCSTAQCLATNTAANFEFLIYSPSTSAFTVNLSAQNGKAMKVQWLDPVTGAITNSANYTATSSTTQSFTPPGTLTSDAVLYLVDVNGGPGAPVGSPSASLSPTSISFGSVIITQSSSPTVVTLTNVGTATMNISSIALSGTNASEFSKTTTCGATLAQTASCTINVTFSPVSVGAKSASLVVTSDATNSPNSVTLTGTGINGPIASFAPASVTFNGIKIGLSSVPVTIVLTNTGGATMNISSLTLSGTNPGDFSLGTTCGATLAASANCNINVTFTPLLQGVRNATVRLASNTANGVDTVPVSGTGFFPVSGTGTISGAGTIVVQP